MRIKKHITVTEEFLTSVTLPTQTDSYTVISHAHVICKVSNTLKEKGFKILKSEYQCTDAGQIAQATIHIENNKDPEMGMIFTWWNSYNKMVKFGCAIGGLIHDSQTKIVGTEGLSWVRKHTGAALEECYDIIEQLVESAENYFDKIISEKNKMQSVPMSPETFGSIMGALYFDLDIITITQAQAIKREYKHPQKPILEQETLWDIYKLLMFGIKDTEIKKWCTNQQRIHYAIIEMFKDQFVPLEANANEQNVNNLFNSNEENYQDNNVIINESYSDDVCVNINSEINHASNEDDNDDLLIPSHVMPASSSEFAWLLEEDVTKEELNDIKEISSTIENKMIQLYGEIKSYNYQTYNDLTIVTLEESKEFFYLD